MSEAEEKAKEYAKKYQDLPINSRYQTNRRYAFESSRDGFIAGHQSRDEEVNQLETNLRKFIDMCSSPCVIDEERFNDELNDLIMRSKLLLKGGKDD